MKLPGICSLAALIGIVCVTAQTQPGGSYTGISPWGGHKHHSTSSTASRPPYIVTAGDIVTSVDYDGTKTSVWVYPTGSIDYNCTVAVYEEITVITVLIININIAIINGQTKTLTSTIHSSKPTWTPLPPPPSRTTTASVSKKTHHIIVGYHGLLKYHHNQITAKVGDTIRFDFNGTNHTVTQSSFSSPCTPLEGGFDTSFNQYNNHSHTGITFRDYVVEVDTSLWFYCAQTVKVDHCHKGMVLGVNPRGKFPEFLHRAMGTGTAASGGYSVPMATGTGKGWSFRVSPTHTPTIEAYDSKSRKGRRSRVWFA